MKRMFVSKTGAMYRLGGGLRICDFLLSIDETEGTLIRADGEDVDTTYYCGGREVGFRVVQMGGEDADA